MCGIAGVSPKNAPAVVSSMLERLTHRGPDGRGQWEDAHHALGHTRLSIIDIQGGAQPMADAEGKRHVVFNGEIYNYRELRKELSAKTFRTKSDTEAILNVSDERVKPSEWTRKLDGIFAFALANGPEIVLARDPLGVKPLYTGLLNDSLVFASELKAMPGGCRNVAEFPPGHVFTSRSGIEKYYEIPVHPNARNSNVETSISGLRTQLDRAVKSQLVSDVPLGVFLSGGLDSSIMAALACHHMSPVQTFFVGTANSRDRLYARQVAEFLGTRHHERLFTEEEALDLLPRVIFYLESFDCALIRSAIPNYILARLASEHVKVALSGEGADELFAGYDYLKEIPLDELEAELLHITNSLHNTNLQRCDRMSMAHGLEVRVPFLDVGVIDCAFRIPVEFKQHGEERTEKWILRKMSEELLPSEIAWRRKEKFAIGAGLGDMLARHAERKISDAAFGNEREVADGIVLRSKEELYYYRIFEQFYPDRALLPLIGRSRSV